MEKNVVESIIDILDENGIDFRREVKIGERCRVDFLVGDIAIEVKKGKPNSGKVVEQLLRYSKSDDVGTIILVSERGLFSNIREANGKPVRYITLSKNWGI